MKKIVLLSITLSFVLVFTAEKFVQAEGDDSIVKRHEQRLKTVMPAATVMPRVDSPKETIEVNPIKHLDIVYTPSRPDDFTLLWAGDGTKKIREPGLAGNNPIIDPLPYATIPADSPRRGVIITPDGRELGWIQQGCNPNPPKGIIITPDGRELGWIKQGTAVANMPPDSANTPITTAPKQ